MRSAETPPATSGALWWDRAAAAARSGLAPVASAGGWLYARPPTVLAGCIAMQWLGVLAFALAVRHNGWVYYHGGDQIWYTTSAWLIAHGVLPPTVVGFGWVVPLVPVGLFAGPEYVNFLPAVMVLNVLVLGPLALACIYGIAHRIGGRALGLYAAAFWAVAPFLAILFFRDDYHDRYVEQFLPQALGLTALADFPSMVCLIVAAYLLVRAFDALDWTWPAAAGLAAGVGATIKPANLLFFVGPALLVLLSRRWRLVLPYAAGALPTLLLLALWKQRGLGSVPAFSMEETRVAAGSVISATALDRYVELDWDTFRSNMASLREYFYSVRVLQWIPLAGVLAVARRSLPLAGLFAGWFGAFLLIKGTAVQSTVDSGSFFRLLMPAYPAYFVLFASIPILVPGVLRRAVGTRVPVSPRPLGRRTLAVAAVLFVAIPAVVIAAPQPLSADEPEAVVINTILTPVNNEISVTVTPDGEKRTLTWRTPDFGPTRVFYRVFRTAAGGADVECTTGGSPQCSQQLLVLGTTREARYVDLSPPEDALYRIGIATNWQDDPTGGDVISVSEPVAATP